MTNQQSDSVGDRQIPLSRHRRAIAANMNRSARIPQFGLYKEIDMSRLVDLRRDLPPDHRWSYSDAIIAACSQGLRSHPALNASFDETESCIIEHGMINIGLAVPGESGLIITVIRGTDRLTLPEIARERQRLTAAAEAGKLRSADLFGGTFAISNLGPAGVPMFQALLVPPLAAILAVGALRETRGTTDSGPAREMWLTVCLTLDHRVLDGLAGAAFLNTLASLLENPEPMVTRDSASMLEGL